MDLEITQKDHKRICVLPLWDILSSIGTVVTTTTKMGGLMQTTIVSMTMVSLGGDNLVVMTMTKTDGSMMEYWVIDIQQIGNKLWIPTVIHMVITTAQTAVM